MMCAALLSHFLPHAMHQYLDWSDQYAVRLVCSSFLECARHPYVTMAMRHCRCTDGGVPLSEANALRMLASARRRGTDLVEVVVAAHRGALLELGQPSYPELIDLRADGFLYSARSAYWKNDGVRAAHLAILRALRQSQFSLTFASSQYKQIVSLASELDVADYTAHLSLVSCNHALDKDEQANDIAMRTNMPQGYAYLFTCALVHTRLLCVKQMEMLDLDESKENDNDDIPLQ